jgi:hypothetical protein
MTCRHFLTIDARRIVVTLQQHLDPEPVRHAIDCLGCLPCDKRHCSVCAAHLDLSEYGTCVDCLGQARRDLVAGLDLVAMLPDHALNAARWSHLIAADPIPGGDAIVMLARGSEGLSDDGTTNPGYPMPPSYLLSWWEETWRDALDQPYPRHRPHQHAHQTLLLAYAYLNANLGWAAAHHPGFGVFAGDIAGMRRYLEELLHAGDYPAEGVACFQCGATLIREYRDPVPCRHVTEAERAGLGFAGWVRILASYPELGDEHAACDQGGLQDPDPATGWRCSRCKRRYTVGEYMLAVRASYDEHADWRTQADCTRLTGVPRGSIQGWASKEEIRKRRDPETGRVVYSLIDIRTRAAQRQVETA